jgi:hypothetical protein
MRERVELAGGRFQLESRPGAGVVVRVSFDLPSAALGIAWPALCPGRANGYWLESSACGGSTRSAKWRCTQYRYSRRPVTIRSTSKSVANWG